jgi:hypothetical protein
MPRWRLGAYDKRVATAALSVETKSLSKIRQHVTYQAVAWAVERKTSMVLGFGLGITDDAATAEAIKMAYELVEQPSVVGGPILTAFKRPSDLKSYTSDAGLREALWFQFTIWNLSTLSDGATPAMRMGFQDLPWSAGDILRAAGLSDRKLGGGDAKFSDSLGSAHRADGSGKRHLPPDLCALRDQDIKSREFGWLRVIGIRYSKSARAGRSVPEIERCECRCKCGAIKDVAYKHLMAGEIESCGCKGLAAKFGADIHDTIEVMGRSLSIGQLASLVGKSPTVIAAAMRRGASAETAAFGTGKVPVQ